MLHIQKETGVYLMTVERLEGFEFEEYHGLVTGHAIYGANFIKDWRARLSDKFGGRVDSYESAMQDAIDTALRLMVKHARKAGANAVIGVHVDTGDINNRMLRATCHGTAVRFKRKPSTQG